MKKQILEFIMAGGLCLSSAVGIFPSTDSSICEAYTQYASLQRLDIANNKDTIAVGETIQLVPVWGNGAKRELTYTSDNENVVTVDETGLVTGAGKGTAVITAAYADIKEPVTITITVDSGADKSKIYNTSELELGDKLRKNDTLHYDKKNIGGTANIVNAKGGFDIVFISEKDYVLPFDAEVAGFDGATMYLAPDIEGIKYVDARTLSVGDTIDQSAVLLCYDYHTNRRVLPVFLPEYYGKYIGNGVISVKDIDHVNKTITLEAGTKVNKDAEKGVCYDTSELKLGDKLHKYDILHHDKKKMGVRTLLHNATEECDIFSISGNDDYDLTFDAEVVDVSGSIISIAPDIEGVRYVDARTLSVGDIIDRETYLLCYDYRTNGYVKPVFQPEFYNKLIGEGNINVKDIDHENKTITLEAETKVKKVIQGDADMNGIVDKADISAIRDRLLKKLDLSENELKTCDMNDDGKLNVVDYLIMKRMLTEKQQNTETYGQAKTPENMPEIIDEYRKVSDKLKEIIWMILKTKYPRTDLSDFKLVYTPKPPLSVTALQNTTGWDFFTIYYKDIPLHEYRSYVADIPQQVGKWIDIEFGTDPSVIKDIDTEAECISEDRLHEAIIDAADKNEEPFVIDTEKQPRKVIYADTDGKTAKLAYSAVDQNGRSEFIIDAVTGEVLEFISYITT